MEESTTGNPQVGVVHHLIVSILVTLRLIYNYNVGTVPYLIILYALRHLAIDPYRSRYYVGLLHDMCSSVYDMCT